MEDRLTVVPTEVGRQVTILILTVDPQAAVMATIPMAMARVTATDIPMAPTHTIRILTEQVMELISSITDCFLSKFHYWISKTIYSTKTSS